MLKHGYRSRKKGVHSKTYSAWIDMKTRCYKENHKHYKYYGGRGIIVCQRWIKSFENFLLDMGQCPEGLSLDRFPNTAMIYSKETCRWATKLEQVVNRRNPPNKTGEKGVRKVGEKYQARIHTQGKSIYLGTFNTIKEASKAFKIKYKEIYENT